MSHSEKKMDMCDRLNCNRFALGTLYSQEVFGESVPILFICDQCTEESAQEIRGDEGQDDLPF